MKSNKGLLVCAASCLLALAQGVAAQEAAPAAAAESLFATVNGKPITQKDFHVTYSNYLRQKYYHGQVPEESLAQARKEVTDRLVERILLLDDAKRRGLVADEQRIAQTIAEYDARYAVSQMWQQNRESMLPGLKQQLAEQDLLRQMETIGHTIDEPADADVRAFYNARQDLFTEPEKLRLHTILLKVDPAAPKALWDAARDEAARLVERLRAGEATFEDLAKLHSHDRSADQGGDMGYLHLGMIPEQVQKQIEETPQGTIGAPIDVLEGIAIFRLDERIPAKLMPYESVAGRARELLKRDNSNKAWDTFVAKLRGSSDIKLVESQPPKAAAGK